MNNAARVVLCHRRELEVQFRRMADMQPEIDAGALRADGTETAAANPLMTGVVHVANWVGSQVLQTLTTRTSGLIDQVVVFKRR